MTTKRKSKTRTKTKTTSPTTGATAGATTTEETTTPTQDSVAIGVTITHSATQGLKIQALEGTNIDALDKLVRAAELEITNSRLAAIENAVRQQSEAMKETIKILETVAAGSRVTETTEGVVVDSDDTTVTTTATTTDDTTATTTTTNTDNSEITTETAV